MIEGIVIATIGLSLYFVNKMMKCSSYWAGYLGVIIQGIGIGIIISEYFNMGMLT